MRRPAGVELAILPHDEAQPPAIGTIGISRVLGSSNLCGRIKVTDFDRKLAKDAQGFDRFGIQVEECRVILPCRLLDRKLSSKRDRSGGPLAERYPYGFRIG